MTKNKNSRLKKIVASLVMLLIITALLFSLSSCGGNAKIPPQKSEENDIAYAARVIGANETLRIRFIAASRGYDIAAKDFSDKNINQNDVQAPLTDLAKELLAEAIKASKFESAESQIHLSEFKESLSDMDVLRIAEELKISYDLTPTYGFFDYILVGVGKVLGWLTNLFGQQYIVAIMVFALIIEIIMLPVAIKQQKNSIGMAKLRPKLMKIEKKYAGRNDQATLRKKQEEMMELQRTEGYSPFSGCLPMLLQLIIVAFIVYPIVQNPLRYMLDQSNAFSQALVSYATSSKALGGLGLTLTSSNNVIELLSVLGENGQIEGIKSFALIFNGEACYNAFTALNMPNFSLFGLNLGKTPQIVDVLVLVPILNAVVQWVSMKLSKKWMVNNNMATAGGGDAGANASMKIMDFILPLMTLFFVFQVPALLGIYWLFRSLVSLLKQFIIKTAMPVPTYTEEELREMEREQKAIEKAQRAAIKQQPKYKSLHYIDEDDYEELPEIKSTGSSSAKGIGDIPDIKD